MLTTAEAERVAAALRRMLLALGDRPLITPSPPAAARATTPPISGRIVADPAEFRPENAGAVRGTRRATARGPTRTAASGRNVSRGGW